MNFIVNETNTTAVSSLHVQKSLHQSGPIRASIFRGKPAQLYGCGANVNADFVNAANENH